MGHYLECKEYAAVDGTRYQYRVDCEGTACIERCQGASGCLRIPDSLMGCPVTAIADGAFSRLSSVEDIVCPCKLRSIGSHAFEGCMKLQSILLNDGLLSIGEEAFFLCTSLEELSVPESVRQIGPHPVGIPNSKGIRRASRFDLRFHPNNKAIFQDGDVLYEWDDEGLVLVDGCRFEGTTLECNPRTVRIGNRALSRMPNLQRVILPKGLTSIGDEAFRGSTKLAYVDIPDTLEEIGEAAFSCTALTELRIPRACTRIAESALALGPISSMGSVCPYRSTLQSIHVADGNGVYRVVEDVLYKVQGDGSLQALLAPSLVNHLSITNRTTAIGDTAFAGTTRIGTLEITQAAILPDDGPLLPHCSCERIEIIGAEFGNQRIACAIPTGEAGHMLLSTALAGSYFDAKSFLEAYDYAITRVSDGLEQARLVVARLAQPTFMTDNAFRLFEAFANSRFDDMCIAFGARADWTAFDDMAQAGLLDGGGLTQALATLSTCGDAQACGYLLQLKQTRLGKASWDDYDL